MPRSHRATWHFTRDGPLALLRDDARASVADISRAVNLSQPAVHRRLDYLRQTGYIRSYRAELDYERLGLGLVAYVEMRVQQANLSKAEITNILEQISEIETMAWVTGDFDALLLVRVHNTHHLQDLIFKVNTEISGVILRTIIVLSFPFNNFGVAFESIKF